MLFPQTPSLDLRAFGIFFFFFALLKTDAPIFFCIIPCIYSKIEVNILYFKNISTWQRTISLYLLQKRMTHEPIPGLKVVYATILLLSFLSVNESTYQTRKRVFYFTSKALSVLEKIKF